LRLFGGGLFGVPVLLFTSHKSVTHPVAHKCDSGISIYLRAIARESENLRITAFDSYGAPARELIPPEMDRHRVTWLTTEDGRGYATLRRVRLATNGGIHTSLPRDSVVLRQTLGRRGVEIFG
jgi:hypothetical protein